MVGDVIETRVDGDLGSVRSAQVCSSTRRRRGHVINDQSGGAK